MGKLSRAWNTWRDEARMLSLAEIDGVDDSGDLVGADIYVDGSHERYDPDDVDTFKKANPDHHGEDHDEINRAAIADNSGGSLKLIGSKLPTKKEPEWWEKDWQKYGKGSGYGGYGGGAHSYPDAWADKYKCHTGNILVFSAGNIEFYGGGNSRGLKIWENAIMIDMGDVVADDYVQMAGCNYPELNLFKVIKVKCKDFDAPLVGKIFWTRLKNVIEAEAANVAKLRIVCCCMGGHGRTGIALSILAALFDQVPAGSCPVEFVRKHYCDHAVESKAQREYIQEVTGMEVMTTTGKGGDPVKTIGIGVI